MTDIKLKAVDFFCGGGGMSYGLSQAGIEVVAGIDNDLNCKETYEQNLGPHFYCNDISTMPIDFLLKEVNLKKKDDNLIFVGCSPCQYWSIITKPERKSESSKKSKDLIDFFKKFVRYYRPGFVVVENVPGLSYKKDSPLTAFKEFLEKKGYTYAEKVIDASHYGVPQTRKRYILIATRIEGIEVLLPEADTKDNRPTVREFIEHLPKLGAGAQDKDDALHRVMNLGKKNLDRLELTDHDGGNRLGWANNDDLQIPTYKGRDNIFLDTYGRLWWDKPSSTITTKFTNISNGRFAHPEQNRGLSLREGALLQTFPLNYIFSSKYFGDTARIIGNAVPPALAERIGKTIVELTKNKK